MAMTSGIAAVLLVSAALTQPVTHDSREFVKAAIETNYADIAIGKLALEKGTSEAVRQYGALLVRQHSDANERAKDAASRLGIVPPTGAGAYGKVLLINLSALSGETFDREFANGMLRDHESDMKDYLVQSQKTDAAGVLAKDTLPALIVEFKQAKSLAQGAPLKQSMR